MTGFHYLKLVGRCRYSGAEGAADNGKTVTYYGRVFRSRIVSYIIRLKRNHSMKTSTGKRLKVVVHTMILSEDIWLINRLADVFHV